MHGSLLIEIKQWWNFTLTQFTVEELCQLLLGRQAAAAIVNWDWWWIHRNEKNWSSQDINPCLSRLTPPSQPRLARKERTCPTCPLPSTSNRPYLPSTSTWLAINQPQTSLGSFSRCSFVETNCQQRQHSSTTTKNSKIIKRWYSLCIVAKSIKFPQNYTSCSNPCSWAQLLTYWHVRLTTDRLNDRKQNLNISAVMRVTTPGGWVVAPWIDFKPTLKVKAVCQLLMVSPVSIFSRVPLLSLSQICLVLCLVLICL